MIPKWISGGMLLERISIYFKQKNEQYRFIDFDKLIETGERVLADLA
jgi:hypothetical protein